MFGHTNHTQLNGHHGERASRVTIRRLANGDEPSLRELVERDTARGLDGDVVGAELDGRLMAAISLTDGNVVADPFHRTADLVALLRVRATQVFPPPA
jgi:hypothetical protein